MATILAYTSPALGHRLPMSALMSELCHRGHRIHVRTLSTGIPIANGLGLTADAIDPRIEGIQHDDWTATNPRAALKLSVAVFGRRAVHEVADLTDAVGRVHPDALLVDVNCWGALSTAEAAGIPWTCFSPYTPPLRSPGVPPFGLGLRPLPGVVGRVCDAAVQTVVTRSVERVMLPPINAIRATVNVQPVTSIDEFLRRAPLMLVASGKPFQYQQTNWGDAVQMIGPCVLDPAPDTTPDWLASIDRPIVLVTTSSEKQADANLVQTAIAALADEPVHVVATLPAGQTDGVTTSPNATVCRFVPHGVVLDRAVCAVTHGGMGATREGARRLRTGVRRAIRARPIRGGAPCRGRPMRYPPTRQETVTGAVAREGARSNDNDGWRETGSRGFRSHRRATPRR
jgi:UDP:flavonoid glycosyltransferase YjiC (YdhE family)